MMFVTVIDLLEAGQRPTLEESIGALIRFRCFRCITVPLSRDEGLMVWRCPSCRYSVTEEVLRDLRGGRRLLRDGSSL
jgi:hypothetical protein